ncbi:acyltransferase family protein [Pseudoduganella chitinolytica]|uniref:Acyltransferase family protein n=1 Tax=Pseudoduganella chitinolytica TaxID=34070 RepID=A0ABY8BI38_9BURK|nr:acyltransferase family protein [Pseudoduganella chitinolytica]WEF33939.1 acyltransferase family protein [Pseudoduganella chitinolytica]
MTTAVHSASRLYFLDWLRIAAFFLLILYHTGMYYVTWDWHVKSPYASAAIEPLMLLSSPWRMSLLFLIGGAASGFLLAKLARGRFLRERSRRLLLPLLFGMLVIVPPQSYCEVIEKLGYAGSYADFMRLYVSAYHGFCRGDDCLDLPTWNHLWFLAYLWAYTVVLALLAFLAGTQRLDRAGERLASLLAGPRALLLPAAYLALARIALKPYFEETHALVDDWYNHAVYLPLFLAGVLLAARQRFWAELERLRWHALAIALAGWALLVCLYSLPEAAYGWRGFGLLAAGVRSPFQWCAIVALCGFARRHLDADSAARRYLTLAVYPVYIVHQTLIVGMAMLLKPVRMAPGPEGAVLVVLTLTFSLGIFELVRRVPGVRALFGIAARQGSGSVPAAGPTPVSIGKDALADDKNRGQSEVARIL